MSALSPAISSAVSSAVLIVFARVPRLGQVKTRLAAQLGDVTTLAVYRELLGISLAAVSAVPGVERQLWIDGDDQAGECAALALRHGMSLHAQPAGDLGMRMRTALFAGLQRAEAALIVGTDCPGLDPPYLNAALAALARSPVVLGPAEDGGYVLLGMREAAPIFDGPQWGGAQVLATTRQLLANAAIGWEELPSRRDIDTICDYRRWRQDAAPAPVPVPAPVRRSP